MIGTKNTSRHQATADVESRLVSRIQGMVTTDSTMLTRAVISTPSECSHSIAAPQKKGATRPLQKNLIILVALGEITVYDIPQIRIPLSQWRGHGCINQ